MRDSIIAITDVDLMEVQCRGDVEIDNGLVFTGDRVESLSGLMFLSPDEISQVERMTPIEWYKYHNGMTSRRKYVWTDKVAEILGEPMEIIHKTMRDNVQLSESLEEARQERDSVKEEIKRIKSMTFLQRIKFIFFG